ncbi:MAG: hypothetical protein ACOJUL_02240 [Candidatus Pollutiaquabacter aromativorans]
MRGSAAVGIASAGAVGAGAAYANVTGVFNGRDSGRIAEDQSASGGECERPGAAASEQLYAEL